MSELTAVVQRIISEIYIVVFGDVISFTPFGEPEEERYYQYFS